MHGILFLRCHARLKSRLHAAVMWQMHVINKPSFALCSFQIIEPTVAVSLNALDFTVCYDLKKSTLQLCGLSEHVDVAFITNQKWVWLLSDCYVLWKVLVQVMHAVFQESARCYIECSLYMHNMLLRRLNIPHMRNKWRLVNIYTPACTAILVFTGFLAQPRCSVTWCHVTGLFHSRVNLIVLFLCCFF